MPTTSLQKALKRARKAEAAALRMGVLLIQLRGMATIPEPLGQALADAINDYQALVQAQRQREAINAARAATTTAAQTAHTTRTACPSN